MMKPEQKKMVNGGYMLKKLFLFLFLLMMGTAMTGCYFDPFHDGGYRRGHEHGDRGHEYRGRGYGNGEHEREHHD